MARDQPAARRAVLRPATSLVIPTLDRPADLERCLRSVTRVNPGFDEVLVVEQGDVRRTRKLAARFDRLNAVVLHQRTLSLTHARNLGIERARGDYIFFVDDDTELDRGYVAAALTCFEAHPRVVGLTGPAEPPPTPRAPWARRIGPAARRACRRALYTALLVTSVRRARVLRSGSNSSARWTRAAHQTEWLSGAHCVYRRQVFDGGCRFNPDFIRWGFGEDVMLSHQVHKRYGPGSLRFDPAFRLTHHSSVERSLTADAVVRMMVIYRFLFWYTEVYGGSRFNLLCYLYGQPGFVLWHPLQRPHTRPLRRILATTWASYRFLARHWRAVVRNRIDYNHFILHGDRE